jgi:hypothetical protein
MNVASILFFLIMEIVTSARSKNLASIRLNSRNIAWEKWIFILDKGDKSSFYYLLILYKPCFISVLSS